MGLNHRTFGIKIKKTPTNHEACQCHWNHNRHIRVFFTNCRWKIDSSSQDHRRWFGVGRSVALAQLLPVSSVGRGPRRDGHCRGLTWWNGRSRRSMWKSQEWPPGPLGLRFIWTLKGYCWPKITATHALCVVEVILFWAFLDQQQWGEGLERIQLQQ